MALGDSFKYEHGLTFVDQYSARRIFPPLQSPRPDILSVEVISPFTLLSSGQAWVHDPDNIVFTTAALNLFKHIQLPIFLTKTSKYYGNTPVHSHKFDPVNPRRLRMFGESRIAGCRRLAAIRRQVPHRRRSPMRLEMNPKQLE